MTRKSRRYRTRSRANSTKRVMKNSYGSPPKHIRESLGRLVNILQTLAVERPMMVPLLENFAQGLMTEKRHDDPPANDDNGDAES